MHTSFRLRSVAPNLPRLAAAAVALPPCRTRLAVEAPRSAETARLSLPAAAFRLQSAALNDRAWTLARCPGGSEHKLRAQVQRATLWMWLATRDRDEEIDSHSLARRNRFVGLSR